MNDIHWYIKNVKNEKVRHANAIRRFFLVLLIICIVDLSPLNNEYMDFVKKECFVIKKNDVISIRYNCYKQ